MFNLRICPLEAIGNHFLNDHNRLLHFLIPKLKYQCRLLSLRHLLNQHKLLQRFHQRLPRQFQHWSLQSYPSQALVVLAQNLPSPDDLLLAPNGSIYISDVQDQTIKEYTQDGNLQTLISGLSEPEGMVVLPDGSLIIAEQGKNRLVHYDPTTKALSLFLAFRNTTGQDGVDGIAYDLKTQTIIVPDSPNGTVLRVSLDGKTVSEIAHGFARPTGAWVEADGSILVVDENANSLS